MFIRFPNGSWCDSSEIEWIEVVKTLSGNPTSTSWTISCKLKKKESERFVSQPYDTPDAAQEELDRIMAEAG